MMNLLKRPAFCTLILWLAFLGMHGYYFLLDYWNTPHPSYIPLFTFIAIQVTALLLVVVLGVWRLIRKPERLKTIAWLTLAFLPGFLWYSLVSLNFQNLEERRMRHVEASWYFVTSQCIAAALVDGIGRWTLPNRLEGERVVMFYGPSIADPKGDLEKMDAFIKKEERFLDATMPTKIHWMRDNILGMPGLAFSWVAITGSGTKSDGTVSIASVDFHEAAHNIISIPSANAVYAGDYPPGFLIEGWAMTRSENWEALAERCWDLKQSRRALTVREMASDEYYNQFDDRIYQQGGAFVKVLLDKFGPEKFREIYMHCTRKTREQDFERIYGMSLEELDSLYWNEIESYHAEKHSFEKAVENLSSSEKALLEEFRQAYGRQMRDFDCLTENGTLEAVVRSSSHGSDVERSGQRKLLFQARGGRLSRVHQHYDGSSITRKNGEEVEESTRRIDCHLLTPLESLATFQYSQSGKASPQQRSWRFEISLREQEYRQQQFRRQSLCCFRPFSLFFTGYGHAFSNPDDYLWDPPIGTVIRSIVVEGDIVVLTLTLKDEKATLTLRMDRKRDWLLLEAQCRQTINGKSFDDTNVHEYGEAVMGVPLLKRRTVTRTGESGRSTEETELVRFDPVPADESEFLDINMPLAVPKPGNGIHSEQRLRLHWSIAACLLIIPLGIILWPKQRKVEYLQAV